MLNRFEKEGSRFDNPVLQWKEGECRVIGGVRRVEFRVINNNRETLSMKNISQLKHRCYMSCEGRWTTCHSALISKIKSPNSNQELGEKGEKRRKKKRRPHAWNGYGAADAHEEEDGDEP
ncbi:hypothetical protein HAX54_042223 [Datura stramonium]|uniref:Uncharacterized protein n=1 Tax=Datura stramonium TaxID=4076 RepID=A0ABS8W0D6_DATST|nr:hypothetical protein [Datura stramonium]